MIAIVLVFQETIFKNYNSIEFFPEKFTEYLLSPVVGFAKSEILGYPHHQSKGFRRPIQVFTKSTMFPSERIEATPNSITPNNAVYNDSLYQKLMKTGKYESQTQPQMEKLEHIYYTSMLNRYCGSSDDNFDANNAVSEDLNTMVVVTKVAAGQSVVTDGTSIHLTNLEPGKVVTAANKRNDLETISKMEEDKT